MTTANATATTTAHLPGKFVWFELHTTDVPASQRFYGEVVGWKGDKMTMPDGTEYPFIKAGEHTIGGYQKLKGPAPHFLPYLSVEDVDASAKKVKKAGGKVLADAFDAPTVGRICIVQDPQGATLALFHAEDGDPADRDGAAGDFHWNELWSSDVAASKAFYEDVFGFEVTPLQMPQGEYFTLNKDGKQRAGLMQAPDAKIPTMWLPYVQVDDVDAASERAAKQGGELKSPLMDTQGVGRHGVLAGPDGAVVGIIAPAS